jgi:hypothetical protein
MFALRTLLKERIQISDKSEDLGSDTVIIKSVEQMLSVWLVFKLYWTSLLQYHTVQQMLSKLAGCWLHLAWRYHSIRQTPHDWETEGEQQYRTGYIFRCHIPAAVWPPVCTRANIILPLHYWEPGTLVSIVSNYGLDDRAIEVRSPSEAEDFSSSLCVQTGSEAHPAPCTMGTGDPFPGGKARSGRDADHSPLSSAEVVNEWSYYSSPPQRLQWRVAGLLYFTLLLLFRCGVRD